MTDFDLAPETLDVLPGEGETQTVYRKRLRHECEVCGELAHVRHTFLLLDARRNPASSGYRRDDLSFCSDESLYSCHEHAREVERMAPDGMRWSASMYATERFAHMFLYWEECTLEDT